MIDSRLWSQLHRVASRLQRLRLWRLLSAAWLLAAIGGVALWGLDRVGAWHLQHPFAMVVGMALAAAAVGVWLARAPLRDPRRVARQVEMAYPELNSCLLAAVEQQPELPGRRFGFLQDCVIRSALRHARQHDWEKVVGRRQFAAAFSANLASLSALACVLAALEWYPGERRTGSATADMRDEAQGRLSVAVEPGNTEVERGTSLLVLARFTGPPPGDATLVYKNADGEVTRLAMAKSLDDPLFGGRVAVVDEPLDYHVELSGQTTEEYHAAVFEYPQLVRADATLVFPVYTSLEPRLIEYVRAISAVEGTEITLTCNLNKRVASAILVEQDAEPIVLAAVDEGQPGGGLRSVTGGGLRSVTGGGLRYQAVLHCDRSRRLELKLIDEQGRPNKKPAQFAINVLPNKPPDLKLAFPARDIEVSPLEEADIKATAWDDFGLKRYGVAYSFGGAEPAEIVLGSDAAGRLRHELAHVVRFEELQAQPDQLLSYYFWAEDVGPDGAARRTESDMYFAEVRPFEEIFRQGDQPPGGDSRSRPQQGGGENAEAAGKLGQLEKEIISATWKLIRRETADRPSDALADDAELVSQSQGAALEQAVALAEKLDDIESRTHAAAATQSMLDAVAHLRAARDGPDARPLAKALSAEQAAYQALLKLRAREHHVIRGRQADANSPGSTTSRSQQQLEELELASDENRYETQRTAPSEQEQEDRETRQVLNRLGELARRQNDLNEQLKELRSALEEARDEERRQEIRRQLKRLQEEEQQILRDTDELKARMETPENQERMAAERQQLEETRDQVRRASESMDEEQVARDAAAGTRAQRDFEELRNEFRRRASGRFQEDLREMRDMARQLDENEQRLAQRLSPEGPQDAPPNSPGHPRQFAPLGGDDERDELPDEMRQQQERLDELLQRMRQTVEEAEPTEPLLSQRLYDAARHAQEQDLDRALAAAEQSLRRGLLDDSRQQEDVARRGIGELREGVERAAESVLGDDTEALRRAHEELDRLARELSDEVERNASRQPDSQEDPQATAGPDGERPSGRGSSDIKTDGPPRPQDRVAPNTVPQEAAAQNAAAQNAGGQDAVPQNTVPQNADGGKLAPIAGEGFLDWSDRLRDVEEMVDDPRLGAEAARIRDQARGFRVDLKRHAQPPNWGLVRVQVLKPLAELRDRVAEELLRRTSREALVPLDRDPVPPKYSEKTRRYYERLGIGK